MIVALQTLIFFRESLLGALDRLVRPYYKSLSLTFNRKGDVSDDEESEEQVFAEYDDEKGVVFFPPVYVQRYAAVSDCLMDERWCGKLEKVVDLGYHDMSFIKYLKEVPGVRAILGVDIESIPLRCSSDLLGCDDYAPKRETPLQVTLFQGNAADPDFRLIGCDAVIAIEMIEHMLPHDLDRLVHTVFGFIKPWIAIFTTPNGDFNVLFNSLEKNGLRRLDHFFEWSREQFHDWCSNIVVRYPQYQVSCRGIGPGPPDTVHLGCCSQMALFVSKDYHKQQDLNLNSLALVANSPDPNDLSDVIGSWENIDTADDNMLCLPNNVESSSDLYSEKQSCVTIVIASHPSYQVQEYRDKMSQCNLDVELGKSFLMFDENMYDILVPRRKFINRVYEIEDVASRLNCTTHQVTTFSKTTQHLMAKNRMDSLVHTREVVDEIRNLTKMLNFNKTNQICDQTGDIWCNINWGDNAPYWNQYYKIVREYNYPFETKSDDCRILDLISEEINRLIDTQHDEELSVDVNKLEIPIDHLMNIVQHITDDVDRVRELMEWNGYEVQGDMVIHSRLVVDNASIASLEEDWLENDTFSDWDTTDVHSTSLSDGSTIVPDYHGRCLRRALDHKVRRLRSMLTADEDITAELDRVVCRLMKLALRTSKGRQTPPPTRWMQCKMFDLLTLTEKAIDRRRRRLIEGYQLKSPDHDFHTDQSEDMLALSKIKDDDTAKKIMDKYKHLIEFADNITKYRYFSMDTDDDMSTSNGFSKDYELSSDRTRCNTPCDVEQVSKGDVNESELVDNDDKLDRTEAWVSEDMEIVPYPNHDVISSTSDNTVNGNVAHYRHRKPHKRYKNKADTKEDDKYITKSYKRIHSKHSNDKHKINHDDKNKIKSSNSRLIKKVVRKKSSRNVIKSYTTKIATEYGNYWLKVKSKRKIKTAKNLKPIGLPTSTRPIPKSSIEMFNSESKTVNGEEELNSIIPQNATGNNFAATENSLFIDIVMADAHETIALRRTIGTDADVGRALIEDKLFTNIYDDISVNNVDTRLEVGTGDVDSQTIFLYDINEPSTSKGIRHVSMDVQCGTDAPAPSPNYPALSPTTSLNKLPNNIFSKGIKIGDSFTDIITNNIKGTDFGTCTNDYEDKFKTIIPKEKSVGIKIKDSDTALREKLECSTMTAEVENVIPDKEIAVSVPYDLVPATETKLLKPISSRIKIEDSGSEFCGSVGSLSKSMWHYANSCKDTSDVCIESSISKDVAVLEKSSSTKYIRPKLSCGGVCVHSYKDKHATEDVVYQGEWQRYRPKTVVRRRSCNTVVSKKGSDSIKRYIHSKEKIQIKKQDKVDTKQEQKKVIQVRNNRSMKLKQESAKKYDQNKKTYVTPTLVKTVRSNKNIRKISSKAGLNSASSKYTKSTFVTKRPTTLPAVNMKDLEKLQKINHKSYIPLYLKRNLRKTITNEKTKTNQSFDSATTIKINKVKSVDKAMPLTRPKTETLKSSLLSFSDEPRGNISYVVFRNEVENNQNTSVDEQSSVGSRDNSNKSDSVKRTSSPQSMNSSTGSSPSSVATVRAVSMRSKVLSNRKHSISTNKITSSNNESTNSTPPRNKKFTKRVKTAKKTQEIDSDNKENISDVSKNSNTNRDGDKVIKGSSFIGRNKNVFMAQMTTENSNLQSAKSLSKHKTQTPNKSNIKIPAIEDTSESKETLSPSVCSNIATTCDKENINLDENSSNMVLVLDPFQSQADIQETKNHPCTTSADDTVAIPLVENRFIADWMDNTRKNIVESNEIMTDMRRLVEESLNFIDEQSEYHAEIDTETVILSRRDYNIASFNNSFSPISIRTIISNDEDFSNILENVDTTFNVSFNSALEDESIISLTDTRLTITDLDLLSFKSFTSESKHSEHILDDNVLSNTSPPPVNANSNSVRDIFERKEPPIINKNAGALAVQAFSGFSMNAEPVAGDQPDRVNLIDSETGSLALEFARQATSEELFISGRSSDSYESCIIDDDTVVPNWLFNIISQQQSIDDEEEDQLLLPVPVPIPMAEPMFDANGNILEPAVGVGAGAGDGRGIHSDHSQDSSGRGTSLSSSETSSGPQSEAILIDPSAFTTQYEMIRDAADTRAIVPTLVIPLESLDATLRSTEGPENPAEAASSRDDRPITMSHLLAASDVEADVSSIDTDVPDSSDN